MLATMWRGWREGTIWTEGAIWSPLGILTSSANDADGSTMHPSPSILDRSSVKTTRLHH
jgi:hypothetical protein